jgi:hypothetical protein
MELAFSKQTKMKIFLEERDNLHIRKYLNSIPECDIIDIGEFQLENFVEKIILNNIDVVVQIAPQWQWGKYVEEISMQLMNAKIKLLAGEGAMFRWLGDVRECGADIGFYLSPWGYSGNSKLSNLLPDFNKHDKDIAKKIIASQTRWDKSENNGKILIAGQLENDRSRMYCKKVKTNHELIENVLKAYSPKKIVFRKHPLDNSDYNFFDIEVENSSTPLISNLHKYAGLISINSTSTIEGLCIGIPVFNFETSPWYSCLSVGKGDNINLIEHSVETNINDIASLISLHYLSNYNYGNPFNNALKFYSDYNTNQFNYKCISSEFLPTNWDENIRFNKY